MLGYKRLQRLAVLFVILFGFSFSGFDASAYDYQYKSSTLTIDSASKRKIDIFFLKKIKNDDLANVYIRALKKYNYSRLSPQSKKVVDYLLYKLETYVGTYKVPVLAQTVVTPTKTDSPSVVSTSLLSQEQSDLISSIKSKAKDYVEVDDKYEFVKNGITYLLDLTINQYYDVDFSISAKSYLSLPTISNEVLYKKGDKFYISKGGFIIEQKITIPDLKNKVRLFSTSSEPVIIEIKNGYYYADILTKYSYFQIPQDGFYLSRYSKVKDLSNSILLLKDGVYQLISEYPQKKLFSTAFLDGTSSKDKFLKYIGTEIYNYTGDDVESMMIGIKAKALSLTQSDMTSDDKIKDIYSWITGNIAYDSYSLDYVNGKVDKATFEANVDTDVFSGIGAFKNENAVCDGYSHLFFYMLYFAGIENVDIETGEANVGANVWIPHAWNTIGEYYYDSTWDISSNGYPSLFKWFKKSGSDFFTVRRLTK
ncbi:MAG: hypothetical protein PHS92_01820 [Candidatus Gracilibacteria bacterium]|nr:hypothetical protein [Candidatus Gracilibacteria bacterium]